MTNGIAWSGTARNGDRVTIVDRGRLPRDRAGGGARYRVVLRPKGHAGAVLSQVLLETSSLDAARRHAAELMAARAHGY